MTKIIKPEDITTRSEELCAALVQELRHVVMTHITEDDDVMIGAGAIITVLGWYTSELAKDPEEALKLSDTIKSTLLDYYMACNQMREGFNNEKFETVH